MARISGLVLLAACYFISQCSCIEWFDDPYLSEYRLPRNSLNPHLQRLTIRLNLSDMTVPDIPFEGQVQINMYLEQPLKTISFNYHLVKVEWFKHYVEEIVIDEEREPIIYKPQSIISTPLYQISEIEYEKELPIGRHRAHIQFSGIVRTDQSGLYRSNYTEDGVVKHLIATHFEPIYARSLSPGFDEPEYRTWIHLRVEHNHPNYSVVSNMPINNTYTTEDGYRGVEFDQTPKMPQYLLAFLISEYGFAMSAQSRIRTYVPQNKVSQAGYSVEFGEKALSHIEKYLNQSYQLPKIDFAAIPHFTFGAMENWGLIKFRSSIVFYDEFSPTKTLVSNIQSLTLLITHELVHMWFGNEVTPRYWNHVWLSEGFARYFEYMATHELQPTWQLDAQYIVRNTLPALASDHDVASTRSMSQYIDQPKDLVKIFDYIVYGKASAVIHMFTTVIGKDLLQAALRNYIVDRSFNWTEPECLYEHLQAEVDESNINLPATVSEIFESWANTVGYPLITVTRNYADREITITQKLYSLEMKDTYSKFYVPISLTDFGSLNTTIWLTPSQPQYKVPYSGSRDTPILANIELTGFYRVDYDEHNWELLIDELKNNPNRFDVKTKAMLISNAASFVDVQLILYSQFLDLLSYLKNEVEYVPWYAAIDLLYPIEIRLRGHDYYNNFEKFIIDITKNVYMSQLRINEDTKDHVRRLHRVETLDWACKFGQKECLDDVGVAIDAIIDNVAEALDKPFIPYEIRTSIYCTAAKYSDDTNQLSNKLYDYLKVLNEQQSDREKMLEEARRVVTGIGCSQDTNFLNQILHISVGTVLPGYEYLASERMVIFDAVAKGSYVGTQTALEFIHSQYSAMQRQYDDVSQVFTSIGQYIVTEELLKKLGETIELHKTRFDEKSSETSSAAVGLGSDNVAWEKTHGGAIKKWLEENYSTSDEGGGSASWTISLFMLMICTMLQSLVQ